MQYQNVVINGLDAIKISAEDDTTSCVVTLFGAHCVSWKVNGEERLFMSSISKFDKSKAIRGGIPVVFPQFGRPDEAMAQHGFARNSMWSFKDGIFSLTESEDTLKVWPHSFRLALSFSLEGKKTIIIALEVTNTGVSAPLECETLLHTYLKVPQIAGTSVKGFQGLIYKDHLGDLSYRENEEGDVNYIDREVDREYQDFPVDRTVSVMCSDSLQYDVKASASIDGEPTSVDVVFWNAWVDKSRATADLDDDGYLHYVCIEPGTIASKKKVEAGSKLILSKTIQVV